MTCQEDGKIEEMPIGIFINVVGVISYFLTNFGLLLLLTIGQLLAIYRCVNYLLRYGKSIQVSDSFIFICILVIFCLHKSPDFFQRLVYRIFMWVFRLLYASNFLHKSSDFSTLVFFIKSKDSFMGFRIHVSSNYFILRQV